MFFLFGKDEKWDYEKNKCVKIELGKCKENEKYDEKEKKYITKKDNNRCQNDEIYLFRRKKSF